MCGICGCTAVNKTAVSAMVSALGHRGPDAQNTWVQHGVSFGHTRLAILDPTPAGVQPMHSTSGNTTIVFNGEIYNFKALIQQFNLQVTTRTDTEVLLALYEKIGIECIQYLRGMFAFALFDHVKNTVYLARDPHGLKPLYYTQQGSILYFASETKALLKALPNRPSINAEALSLYVRHRYVPCPHTLLNGVYSARPGEVLQWSNGALKTLQVYRSHPNKPYSPVTPQGIKNVLQESVAAHLVSDKPIGLFLSGGLDSSICLYHMREAGVTNIKTFTVRFAIEPGEGEEKFNADATIAKRTAGLFETDHTEITITAKDCAAAYAEAAYFLDQPNANPTAVVQYLLSKKAKQAVDVVLTGIGGDELFGGYGHYRIARILQLLQWVPPAMRSSIGSLFGKSSDLWQTALGAPFIERMRIMPANKANALLAGDWFADSMNTQNIQQHYAAIKSHNTVHAIMEYDRLGWLADEALHLADASTMGAGLEARTPFLDTNVLALAHTINPAKHSTLKTTKALLRNAYADVLPVEVVQLRKAGFFPPFAKWVRRDCKPLLDEALESTYLESYFNKSAMQSLAAKHHTGEQYAFHELTMLIQLHYWFKEIYNA